MHEPDILKTNDEIARRFAEIEAHLAACRSAAGLCETLVREIEAAFGIPFVWVTIIRFPETAGLLEELLASSLLRDRLNTLSPTAFQEIVPDPAAPLLAGGDLRRFFRLLPPAQKFFIRSLAVSPLAFHGRPAGSLNLADTSPTRYEPGMDTTLLQHLTRSLSDRLAGLSPRFFA